PSLADGGGPHVVGPRTAHGGTLPARSGDTGSRPHHTALLDDLGQAGGPSARLHPRPAGHLGRLAELDPAPVRRRVLSFTLMTPFFDPGPIPNPEVPVYIAGVGPGLSKMAGEVCDGFHVHPFHTVRYLDEVVLPAITKGAESNGRSLDDVTRVTSIFIATGHT